MGKVNWREFFVHFQNGRYPNVEALAADLEVMFANAKRYNMDESKLFKVMW